jgi:hypothetical protein
MHKALPQGTLTLKRNTLNLLRKFLFIMHYRNVACSSKYFQADHPDNAKARQWIESFMRAKGIHSAVETWLYVLRYYLDTSHSDIMRDAAELIEKYGEEGFSKMMTESHIPPDIEHYPAVTYQGHADSYFLSIWEAAEGEEFILTHNAFGLWEGAADGFHGLHRIFVVSPRIAIVLRITLLRPESKGHVNPALLQSSLLDVNPIPATYASGEDSLCLPNLSATSFRRYRISQEASNDSFVFKITKLSRLQTLELNSVALVNVGQTGSLTFLSRENMLRTAYAFLRLPSNLPQSILLVPLIKHLTAGARTESEAFCQPPVQSRTTVPDEDVDPLSFVDVPLYVLLMQICTGHKQFPSAYDRAYLVLAIMEKGKPDSFAHELSREIEKAFRACEEESEDVGSFAEGVRSASFLSSIPDKLSCQLFHMMIPLMSKLGAVMSGGEEILEELQDQVVVVWFIMCASYSPGVWHTLSCSHPEASKILSGLFEEDTPADRFAATFVDSLCEESSPPAFSSWYDRAYVLRRSFGMTGPTTNPISLDYYRITATLIYLLDNSAKLPPKRSKARLVRTMSKNSDFLLLIMEEFLELLGWKRPSQGDAVDHVIRKRIGEMAIVNTLAWLGKHRMNVLDALLDQVPQEMNFKLFEDEVIGT